MNTACYEGQVVQIFSAFLEPRHDDGPIPLQNYRPVLLVLHRTC